MVKRKKESGDLNVIAGFIIAFLAMAFVNDLFGMKTVLSENPYWTILFFIIGIILFKYAKQKKLI